jgi:hypothetical protein
MANKQQIKTKKVFPPCLGEMLGIEECASCKYVKRCEDEGMKQLEKYYEKHGGLF